jgi:hypothetical protein
VKTLQQPELFVAPVDPYQARVDAALRSSLHSFTEADKRWRKHQKRGLTDAEMKKADSWCGALAYEFGIGGGGSHPEWHQHQGGADPKFWFSISQHGKPRLRGQPLLERVRELLKIPYPLS